MGERRARRAKTDAQGAHKRRGRRAKGDARSAHADRLEYIYVTILLGKYLLVLFRSQLMLPPQPKS